MYYECKKRTLKVFADMTMDSSIDNAINAFEEGITCGARDADGIWATYSRLNSGSFRLSSKIDPFLRVFTLKFDPLVSNLK